ncbi:MAG: DUF2846 domain-containing protein [Tannerella sp.]|jgi:hypothetical protein|nr:DUF2846 domain-containing protein [Tannerella sp.]
MKKLELNMLKTGFARFITVIALMFTTSLLMTSCGTGQTTTSYDVPPPEAQYVLTNDCALLHIYRPSSMMGMAISYDLYLNEWVLFRVKNKTKTTIRITSPGTYTLWAKTEAREELPVNIELGKEYYLRCSVSMGAFVGRPDLSLIDPQMGKMEFDKVPWKK